jgi:hypothetical protein
MSQGNAHRRSWGDGRILVKQIICALIALVSDKALRANLQRQPLVQSRRPHLVIKKKEPG